MTPLVLASRSEGRRALLAGAGVAFAVEPSRVDEAAVKRGHPHASSRQLAAVLAEAKAVEVSRRCAGLVLGADQTLDLDGRLFDKPVDAADLRAQLLALRGRAHVLHAALALAREGEVVWRCEDSATLSVRPFTETFLAAYLAQEGAAALACVGGYRLEGVGVQLFERIKGDYFTVLGLPLLPLLDALRDMGVAVA